MIHNDEYLVQKMQTDNNQLAFAMLFNKYSKAVYALSIRYLKNREMAEDTVQNVFYKVWDRRKQKNSDTPFRHYLFTIAKNELIDTLKNKRYYYLVEDYIESLSEDAQEIEEQELRKEQLEQVNKLIEKMSPQKRRIVELKLNEKISNQEIADKLNISVNTVKFVYSAALKDLREKLVIISIGFFLGG